MQPETLNSFVTRQVFYACCESVTFWFLNPESAAYVSVTNCTNAGAPSLMKIHPMLFKICFSIQKRTYILF